MANSVTMEQESNSSINRSQSGISPLYETAHSNDTAKAMFEEWARRERDKAHIDVGQFRRVLSKKLGVRFNKRDFEQAFSSLSKLGAGRLKLSSRGLPRFFVLSVSLKDLGRAGLERSYSGEIKRFRSKTAYMDTRRHSQEPPKRPEAPQAKASPAASSNQTLVVIPISASRVVRLEVPGTLTASEVGMVTLALSSLRRQELG